MRLTTIYFLLSLCLPLLAAPSESLSCRACKFTIRFTHDTITGKFGLWLFNLIASPVCNIAMGDRMFCKDIIEEVGDLWFSKIFDFLYPEVVCHRLSLCEVPRIVPDKNKDYINRVLSTRPPQLVDTPPQPAKPLNFVVVTDIHVDYEYQEGSAGKCNLPLCCRKSSGEVKDPEDVAGMFGFLGVCDIPLRTLDSFLNYTFNEIKPDFIVWLGDSPPHDIWHQEKKDHLDTVRYISKALQDAGYDKPGKVYPVLGNHEGLPCDTYNLDGDSHTWIIQETAEAWKPWLTPEAYQEYLRTGGYSMLHPGTNLRIIGINPFVIDSANPYVWKNSTNKWNVLDWLEKTLSDAERDHEVVLILSHFPTNCRFVIKEFSIRFAALKERYANIIRGALYGHEHLDYTELTNSFTDGTPAVIGFTNPSLTTYKGVNPSFRVYEMDSVSFKLNDYVQYRLYLDEANKNRRADWRVAYSFRDFYGVKEMNAKAVGELYDEFYDDKQVRERLTKMALAEGPRVDPTLNDPETLRDLFCRMSNGHFYEFYKCKDGRFNNFEDIFRNVILMLWIIPEWSTIDYSQC